jgi:prophage antirepressor-like protein
MTADIQVFAFSGRRVRTAGTHEAPLFCAADVCAVLGIDNVGNALGRLDQDEVESITSSDVQGKNRAIVFVNESGLFSLILGSRKPEAKAFKKWVTSEVLPELRRHGVYNFTAHEAQRLLAECFPKLPSKSAPIFRDLISALLMLRREPAGRGNPPWARSLASWIYGWAIQVDGQQKHRRARNPVPSGSSTDHSMLSELAETHVRRVVTTGCDVARMSTSWTHWKCQMELAFGKGAVQLPFMVPMLDAHRRSEARRR